MITTLFCDFILQQSKVGCWKRDGFGNGMALAWGGSVTNGPILSSLKIRNVGAVSGVAGVFSYFLV